MSVPAPHFLLRSRASRAGKLGRWSFALQSADGGDLVNIEEIEPETSGERLELLALVRGLEALPAPARVTLRPASTHVQRVLNSGLDEWRDSDWQWERHGQMVPVKNADLWRRIDRALHFHDWDRCGDRSQCIQQSGDRNSTPISSILPKRTAHRPGERGCHSRFARPESAASIAGRSNLRNTWARKALFVALKLRRQLTQRWSDCRAAIDRLKADCESDS